MNEDLINNSSVSNIFTEYEINKISLGNQSGAVVALECYVKTTEGGEAKRVGKTDSYPVGEDRTLELRKLEIDQGSYVTAFVNVKYGGDDNAHIWFKYNEKKPYTAKYTICGVVNFTKTGCNCISKNG